MVFLRIVSKSEPKIESIAEILLREKLAIDLNIKRNLERLEYKDGAVVSTRVILLTGKTRGLLFNKIDKRLLEEFGENMPELYTLPIVHMDWGQARDLPHYLQEI